MPLRSARLARRFFITFGLTFAACALACGCGGGGGGGAGSPAPAFVAPTPSPTPSPSPAPGGAVTLSQSTAAFTLAGASAHVTASETGYAGTIVPDASACAGIASVAPASASAPAAFTITAQGSGACAIAFGDSFGQRATFAVGVTITQGVIR
jgi:hypothetical protein